MTKFTSLFIGLLILTSITTLSVKPTENDLIKTKKSVLIWADSTFYHHEEYRFEQFHATYTDLYQMAILRLELYQGKLLNLEKLKRKGFYKKTDSEYDKEHTALVTKNEGLKNTIDNFKNKAESYQILFWSNIKTNQGPTVYYSHLIKLDNNYTVISAEIKSEIGKKNSNTKILYAKDVKKKK